MGASKDFAFERGEEAHKLVLDFLKDRYQADRPEVMNGFGFERKMQAEWDEQAEQLKLILQELIWTSDAASW